MPKGYIIGQMTITGDPEILKDYVARDSALIPQLGGRFLARGGQSEYMEGSGHDRHVVVEFDSFEAAKAAYEHPKYQENMKLRQAVTDGQIVVVEGV